MRSHRTRARGTSHSRELYSEELLLDDIHIEDYREELFI